ncbi:MAG: ADP-ribosylglycohydrolase family protein [Caldilineaceae bacterium]
MDKTTLYQHILGGLYGQALGDAWGMPALLTPQQTWQTFGGWLTDFFPSPDQHFVHAGLPAGRITDDTEQAFALAESILEDGAVTVAGTARAIIAWYDRIGGDSCPYVGPSTRRAVLALKKGVDPRESGRYGDTNGAAMRVAPVGLIHPGDVEAAAHDAAISCTPTHNTDVAASGAAAVAGAIAAALTEKATLESVIAGGIEAARLGRTLAPTWMGASIPHRIQLAVQIASGDQPAQERLQQIHDLIGTTLAISESVPAAFGVLAMAKGDPVQAAIYAAALSGDADTIGAMACAIAGAWLGAGAIPAQHVTKLRAVNPELDFDRVAAGLTELALRTTTR